MRDFARSHAAVVLLLITSGCSSGAEAPTTETSVADQEVRPAESNVRVSADPSSRAQNQPAAAWNPSVAGNLIVASHDYPAEATQPVNGVVASYASFDGGRTFPFTGVVPGLVVGHGGVHQGASDQSLACSRDGSCYLATYVYDLERSRSGIAVNRTDDGGRSWGAPTIVVEEDNPHARNFKCAVAVDDSNDARRGRIYVTWNRVEFNENGGASAAPVLVAASSDRGRTFGAPIVVSTPDLLLNVQPVAVVDRRGRLFIAYQNFLLEDPLYNQQVVQRSDDGARTFAAPVRAAYILDTSPYPPTLFRTNSHPRLAANPLSGAVHLVWIDELAGTPDVLLVSSFDGGASFTEQMRLNDTPAGANIHHALPDVACGPQGICGASFYSSRNDATAALLDVYYAPIVEGRGGGEQRPRTWGGCNVRVTSSSLDPSVQFGGRFIGEYTALAVDRLAAHPVWTDTRVRMPDATGTLIPQQDIFTARVPLFP